MPASLMNRNCDWLRSSLALALVTSLIFGGAPIFAAQNTGGLRIEVVQGGGQNLVIGGRSREVVVAVLDSTGKPVAGATVSFLLGTGGSTPDGLSTMVAPADAQGQARVMVRPNGNAGPWTITVTANSQQERARTTVSLTNVAENAAPVAAAAPPPAPVAAPAGETAPPPPERGAPPPATTASAKKSNKTLIIVILIAAVGGGVGAALGASGKSSGSSPTSTTPPVTTTGLTIGLGTGGFGSPGGPH